MIERTADWPQVKENGSFTAGNGGMNMQMEVEICTMEDRRMKRVKS